MGFAALPNRIEYPSTVMTSADLIQWTVGVALLGVNFFFVFAEFALVRVRATRIQELVEAGDQRAVLVKRIHARIDEFLSVAQVGITGATLGIGVIIESGIAGPIEHALGGDTAITRFLSHAVGFLIATFVVILSSELLPKSLAIRYPDRAALWCARPLIVAYWIFFPFLWVLTKAAMGIMRIFGIKRIAGEEAHSEDELRIILDHSQEGGVLSFRRLLFIENVFDLGELKVKDAMRPAGQAKVLDARKPWGDNEAVVRASRFSRFPLIVDDSGRPAGFVHVKDLLFACAAGTAPDLAKLMRPAHTAVDSMPLEQLLAEMQRKRSQIALITDATGKWTGLISFEDIIEEIIGTVTDEFETETPLALAETITPGRIVLGVEAESIQQAVRIALGRVPVAELPQQAEGLARAVCDRERLAPTYLGRNIAMPHARLAGLDKPVMIFARSSKGVPVDGQPKEKALLFFILLTPAGQPRVHQKMQARIAAILENSEYVVERLRDASTAAEVMETIRTGEQAAID